MIDRIVEQRRGMQCRRRRGSRSSGNDLDLKARAVDVRWQASVAAISRSSSPTIASSASNADRKSLGTAAPLLRPDAGAELAVGEDIVGLVGRVENRDSGRQRHRPGYRTRPPRLDVAWPALPGNASSLLCTQANQRERVNARVDDRPGRVCRRTGPALDAEEQVVDGGKYVVTPIVKRSDDSGKTLHRNGGQRRHQPHVKLPHRPLRRNAGAPLLRMTRAVRHSHSPPPSPPRSRRAEHAATSRPEELPAIRAARAASALGRSGLEPESHVQCRQSRAPCVKSSAERFQRVKFESGQTAVITSVASAGRPAACSSTAIA